MQSRTFDIAQILQQALALAYLKADAARIDAWRPRLEVLPGKRVAIAWAGHARHVNDLNRSIGLEQLAPLFA